MKTINFLPLLLSISLLGQAPMPIEKAKDLILSIEDSIHYSVPKLDRLCDHIKLKKSTIDIGDCKLYIEREGKGKPMVLINGGPGGTHHYFHPWFSNLKDQFELIYYDQRGTGRSDFSPGVGYSFQQAVEDLEKLRISLNIDKWTLCGYSYGGALAQLYTAQYPENVSSLILISSLPLFQHVDFDGDQNKYISEIEKNKLNEIIKLYVKGELDMPSFLYNLSLNGDWRRQYYYKPKKEESIRSALYEWVNDKDFNSIMSESVSKVDTDSIFINCPIPTLIFEGADDLTWGTKKTEIFRKEHPRAEFVLLNECGHQVFQDRTTDFFSKVIEFNSSIQASDKESILKWKNQISINPK